MINIIDRNFNHLGLIDEYESFMPSKSYHGIAGFELHLHESNTYADELIKENIVYIDEEKAYVILHRDINSINGKLVVKGLELKSYLNRFIIFPPEDKAQYRINDNVETIMKEYVQATLNRKGINNIVVAINKNRGKKTVYQSRYKPLAEELEKLSKDSGIGWDITLDFENKRFVFDVIEGRNLTSSQASLPPAIFAIEYDNIVEQNLVESRMDYANTAIVAGQGEGVDRAIEIVGDSKGLDSFELFVDARDIEDEDDLPSRGNQKLSEMKEILNFDSEVLADQNIEYEKDYKLGDICTIQNNKWNVTADRRVTQVNEIYERNGFRLDIDFGDSPPTIMDKIKKETDILVAESRGRNVVDDLDGGYSNSEYDVVFDMGMSGYFVARILQGGNAYGG